MKDHEIIQLFYERSEQAIASLTVKYGTAIRKVSAHILRDPQDIEECVNDTYLQIWNSIPPQRPDRLGAFVCRVARNVSLNRHHFNSAHKRNSHFDSAIDELAWCIPDSSTVEAEFDTKMLAASLNSFLATLSFDDRRMFIQRYWLGVSMTDIAAESKLTAHAVSVRLFRLRKKLKERLKKEGIIV